MKQWKGERQGMISKEKKKKEKAAWNKAPNCVERH